MTEQNNSRYRISLPASVAETLVEQGIVEWEFADERSATDAVDIVVAVGVSLGPAAAVSVAKAAAAEAAHHIARILAEKWRATHGAQRLMVDLRARPGRTSLTVEIRGECDASAAQAVMRALLDSAPDGSQGPHASLEGD